MPSKQKPALACSDWWFAIDKGGDPSEWPENLRVREMPEGVT